MAEILVKAVNAVHSDPDKDRAGCYKKGYPVIAKEDGWGWGNEERLPKFILIKCPELTVEQIISKLTAWYLNIEYAIIDHLSVSDTYTVRASAIATNISVSGLGALTRSRIENFLNSWEASIIGTAENQVDFSVNIFDALTSEGFWEYPLTNFSFRELSYDIQNGDHDIELNYYGSLINSAKVNNAILDKGGQVLSHDPDNKIITFRLNRSVAFQVFKDSVKSKVDGIFCRRQFYFTEAQVDTVINLGGEITLTAQQILSAVKNKLND